MKPDRNRNEAPLKISFLKNTTLLHCMLLNLLFLKKNYLTCWSSRNIL